MTLTFCSDLTAADWIADSDLPWDQLVGFGPAGFEAYARLRILPDPTGPGQSENDVDADWRADTLPTLLEVLGAHTATPDDCYFCVWEGIGTDTLAVHDTARYVHEIDPEGAPGWADARPGLAPGFVALPPDPSRPLTPPAPMVAVTHRAYWLFRGPLADVGGWDTAREWPGRYRLGGAEPAFVWPADRAWCVANDVDPHWAGIGGDRSLISRLVADPRLDVVPADPTEDQPHYY